MLARNALIPKIFLFSTFIMCLVVVVCSRCGKKHDYIDIHNKSNFIFDDIGIEIKDGYFYDRHEKFTMDDNTIAVTIYFSNKDEDDWD